MKAKYDLMTVAGRGEAEKAVRIAMSKCCAAVNSLIACEVFGVAEFAHSRKLCDGSQQTDLARKIIATALPGDEIEIQIAVGAVEGIYETLSKYGKYKVGMPTNGVVKVSFVRDDRNAISWDAVVESEAQPERHILDNVEGENK